MPKSIPGGTYHLEGKAPFLTRYERESLSKAIPETSNYRTDKFSAGRGTKSS